MRKNRCTQNYVHYTIQGRKIWRGRGAIDPPIYDRLVNPISTRRSDYAPHITTPTSPIFRPSFGPVIYFCCQAITYERNKTAQWGSSFYEFEFSKPNILRKWFYNWIKFIYPKYSKHNWFWCVVKCLIMV